MDKPIQNLYSFVDSAVRSRKYPESTGRALKAALKLFEAELNEDEKSSIKLFAERLDQIYSSVFAKNQTRFSAGSLATYKSRVIRLVSDYKKYGVDPTKMVSWSPQLVKRVPRKSDESNQPSGSSAEAEASGTNQGLSPPRTLPSGIVVSFPTYMDAHVSFGEFGEELKKLNEKGLKFAGETFDGKEELL